MTVGYVADSDAQAADDFFPASRASLPGSARNGWPPTRRSHYDAMPGPTGALIIGGVKTVVEKILHYNEVLGGVSRLNLQMSPGTLPHAKALQAIELLGDKVAPLVRKKASAR